MQKLPPGTVGWLIENSAPWSWYASIAPSTVTPPTPTLRSTQSIAPIALAWPEYVVHSTPGTRRRFGNSGCRLAIEREPTVGVVLGQHDEIEPTPSRELERFTNARRASSLCRECT